MKPLSIEQIEQAREKLLNNAEQLFTESLLLFENGHFARSYTLSHLCCEEIAKIPMLVGAGLDIVAGEEVDWKKLGKRLTSHTEKIEAVHAHDYFRSEIRADDSDFKAYEKAMETIPHLNNMKNNSLYAGIVGDNYVQPSEVVSAEDAVELISITKDRLAYIQHGEKHTRGAIAKATGA